MNKIAVLIVALATCTPVNAQGTCGPTDDVYNNLTQKFGEHRQSQGLSVNGIIVETWGNSETGTWTILTTTVNGTTCLLASGEWFRLEAQGEDL